MMAKMLKLMTQFGLVSMSEPSVEDCPKRTSVTREEIQDLFNLYVPAPRRA